MRSDHPVTASEAGKLGAQARNRALTDAQRTRAARKAARARWEKHKTAIEKGRAQPR